MKKLNLSETADFFRRNDGFVLVSHRRPDGDTCGSCAALCRGLRAIGKNACIYPNSQFTPKFAPCLEGLVAQTLPEEPIYVTVDVADVQLFPFSFETTEIPLAIDHHGTNTGFAEQSLLIPERAACGEIISDLLLELGIHPSREMAEAIYIAVSTDTGCFRYSNVTANTFRVAAHCIEYGAKIFPINRALFETKRKPRLQLEAYLIQNMEFYRDGLVAIAKMPQALLDELDLSEDDVDDISGIGRTVEGVEIAVMLRDVEPGSGKVSMRTGPGYDAAAICACFGGGGHPAAAGGSVPGGIEEAKKAVLAAIEAQLS